MTQPHLREAALDVINSGEMAWEKLSRLNAAYAEMVAAARNFDGSYEAARARFNAVKETMHVA